MRRPVAVSHHVCPATGVGSVGAVAPEKPERSVSRAVLASLMLCAIELVVTMGTANVCAMMILYAL
jgi:hypothetical protein